MRKHDTGKIFAPQLKVLRNAEKVQILRYEHSTFRQCNAEQFFIAELVQRRGCGWKTIDATIGKAKFYAFGHVDI
ncbi:MAG: hypothetical protein NW208_04265 [Bryobacter sp.]|nr:hypothetical protein [Bryobacter sp.]